MNPQNATQFLENLGFSHVERRGDEFHAKCIWCGKRKFYLNASKDVAVCFRGCFTGRVEALVVEVEGVDWGEAKARVQQGTDWFSELKRKIMPTKERSTRKIAFEFPGTRDLSREEELYLLGRNIEPCHAITYGACGCDDLRGLVACFLDCAPDTAQRLMDALPGKFDYLLKRIIWPIHAMDDRTTILSAEARSVSGAQPKVLYPQGINVKESILIGYNVTKTYNWVVVVEGRLDHLSSESWNFPTIATFSGAVSKEQSAYLHKFQRIYCAYDADTGGHIGRVSLVDRCYEGVELMDMALPMGKDPNDCSRDEFERAFIDAKPFTEQHPAVKEWRKKRKRRRR